MFVKGLNPTGTGLGAPSLAGGLSKSMISGGNTERPRNVSRSVNLHDVNLRSVRSVNLHDVNLRSVSAGNFTRKLYRSDTVPLNFARCNLLIVSRGMLVASRFGLLVRAAVAIRS